MQSSLRKKVFLSAFINQTNAQNLNCLALAKYLDQDRYRVYTLAIAHGNLGKVRLKGIHVFTCIYPVSVTAYLGIFWGIFSADVIYLPRANFYKWERFLTALFRRKSFKTIENIIDEESLTTAFKVLGSVSNVLANYRFCTKNFSITGFMREYNFKRWKLSTEEMILPLITDTGLFKRAQRVRQELAEVIFIGNDMARKGVHDYVRLAAAFPQYAFHIVGSNSSRLDLSSLVREAGSANIMIHGMLSHDALLALCERVQLHVLPSRSEGFPRSIIETSAAGIPTLTYVGYGAEEWIENDANGYVAVNWEAMKAWLHALADKEKVQLLSAGAIRLSERFDAEKIVKKYETVIDTLYEE